MFQGVTKASAAFRLMQQMGWEEGNGLGKEHQGITTHLRVRKRPEFLGIGSEKKHNWALNTTEYDSILKSLNVVTVKGVADKIEEEGDSEDDAVDNELQPKQKDEEPVKVRKLTRPQGRYKKREQSKLVGACSKNDLDAILGASGKTGLQTMANQQYVPNKILTEAKAVTAVMSDPVELKKVKKGWNVEITEQGAPETCSPSLPSLPEDWWGNKLGFVRAGSLGASSGAKTKKRTAFCEQDQEDLYKHVQDKATTGRKGLGNGDQKRGNLGGDWKGRKTALDSGSDEEIATSNPPPENQEARKKRGKKEKEPVRIKKRKMEKEARRKASKENADLE